MRFLARPSIVLQLWLRLSALAVTFAALALGTYLWLAIEDTIAHSERQASARATAVLTALRQLTESSSPPSQSQLEVASGLGIELIEIISPSGEVQLSLSPTGVAGAIPPVDPALLQPDTPPGIARSTGVRFTDDGFEPAKLTPLTVLSGGDFGVSQVYPLTSVVPGENGGVRVVSRHENLVDEARIVVFRSLVLTACILGVTVAGMRALVNDLVAKPLQNYSETAMRIAAGDPVRMPIGARDELGQLGRAINGMADALRHQATVDPLTGLYNLRHLTSGLESLMENSRQSGAPLALLVGDLDNFKPVNDTYGHQAGDLVLQTVAQRIRAWGGGDFTSWRIGGDEFAAAMPNTSYEKAVNEARLLQETINTMVVEVPGGQVRISISLGIALFPADGETAGTLLNAADRRMYEAKAAQSREERQAA